MGGARVRRRRRGHNAPPANPPTTHKPSAERSDISDQSPPKTLPLSGSILPVPADVHLLEVRDSTHLLFPPLLSFRPPPPPEIHDEEPAQRHLDCRCFALLLVALFCHQARGPNRRARPTGSETEG